MGWLSNLFKPKPYEETKGVDASQEINLDSLILLLEKKVQERNSVFENDLRNYHKRMTDSMQGFSKALSELLTASGPDKIDEGLMKVAKSYCSSMDKSFNETRIEFEKNVTYIIEDFNNYFRNCSSSVGKAEINVAKYINPLKEVFPKEMKNLLRKSETMNDVIEGIKSSLDKKTLEAKPISDLLVTANELRSHREKLSDVVLQVNEAKSNLASMESKKTDLEKNISDFLRGDQWVQHQTKLAELSALEKKMDGIRTFVVQSIVPLDRAMKKLKKIRSDLGKKIEDEELFDIYITDPLEAFLQDAERKVLNRTVLQIKDIFEKISPDLSGKKDQKIMDSILFLESGEVMRKAREDYDKMEEAISKLHAEIVTLGAKESKNRLDEELRIVVNKIPEARANLEKLESLYSRMSEKKTEMFDGVRSSARRALGEEIRIQSA